MHRWERRLADAAHALSNCGKTYFEPELFRRNVNQFLTVSRTVTFLIAKDKAAIPDYDNWHANAIGKYWSGDPVMKWAKDSRNFIEKEGDLDLYSSLSVSLVYSYFAEDDISIEVGRAELVGAGIKTLMRTAEKNLPTGIADGSAVKIERRWVANTLPDRELFQALIYVYSRYYKACAALATYLGGQLSKDVPNAEEMNEGDVSGRRASFVKFSDKDSYSVKSYRIARDPSIQKPAWLKDFDIKRDTFDIYCEMAEQTFKQFGNHLAMAFLFSDEGKVIQHVGLAPADQVDKFLFWRRLAEQVTYLRAESVIFISESWLRKNPGLSTPIRNAEIVGETLQVYQVKRNGDVRIRGWSILRENDEVKLDLDEEGQLDHLPNFFVPVREAFARIHVRPA